MKLKLKNLLSTFSTFLKCFAFAFVICCMVFDYNAIRQLFIEYDTKGNEPQIYAFILALFLEGIPYALGKIVYEMRDKTKYDRNSTYVASISLLFGLVGLAGAMYIYYQLRSGWMKEQGWVTGLFSLNKQTDKTAEFYMEYFRLYSPFVTSIGAFALSFFAFRQSAYESLQKEVQQLEAEYNRKQRKYMRLRNRYKDACNDLWTNLANHQFDAMPDTYEAFREECMLRIRDKLAKNCTSQYPLQIERYSSEIETVLSKCIAPLSKHSSIPYAISTISFAELLKEYDEQVKDPADKWDYNIACAELQKDLEESLESAITAARMHID